MTSTLNLHRLKNTTLYNNIFGFEKNVDVTNDTAVLCRKNIVIKNIIFISNLVYTFIFTIVSIGQPSNWFLTILFIPVTLLVNHTLKKMIYKDKDNLLKQQIAMYMCCFYMFLTAILIYTRLKTGPTKDTFGEVGYMLLYYSLVICSFYQDKKMLKTVYLWAFLIITIIHFSLTYNILFGEASVEGEKYFLTFVKSDAFKDILLRTFILLAFMLVLYVSASMSKYMQDERKKELIKRKTIEAEYKDVVTKIFKVTLTPKVRTNEELRELGLVKDIAKKLASLLAKDNNFINELSSFSDIHINSNFDFNESVKDISLLSKETKMASLVLERIELERKTEEIIRAHLEGSNDKSFTENMKLSITDDKSQILMLADMYVSLRSIRSYKRAYNHKVTMEYLSNVYKEYFNNNIIERFIEFNEDYKNMYDNFMEEEDCES